MTDPINTDKLVSEQYKTASNLDARISLHSKYSTNKTGWFNFILGQLRDVPSDAHVLELGCGNGSFWVNYGERIPPDWVITLSDISEGMLLDAWRSLVVTKRNFKYKQINAQQISFKDAAFDLVMANHMLYHIPNREKAIAEIRRVLKRGGTFIASTNGNGHMKEMVEYLQLVDPGNPFINHDFFTLENGRDLLEKFFEKVEILEYSDSLVIDQVEPVIDYIRSAIPEERRDEIRLDFVRDVLKSTYDSEKSIRISKRTGIFICK
jgi:ubiquinone/menaquinone biosynthesis C-methylase UbiE